MQRRLRLVSGKRIRPACWIFATRIIKPRHLLRAIFIPVIIDKGRHDTFPNLETTVRLYLVLMIRNWSRERSFSKVTFIPMTQERLNDLTLTSNEHDILRQINFNDLINDFLFEHYVIPSQCVCVIFSRLVSSKSNKYGTRGLHMVLCARAFTNQNPALKKTMHFKI